MYICLHGNLYDCDPLHCWHHLPKNNKGAVVGLFHRMGQRSGIICPEIFPCLGNSWNHLFYLIHPHILTSLTWLSQNLAFSFVIGLFFGVFIIDVVQSAQLVSKLKRLPRKTM